MPLKPEVALRKKLEALERHKAMLDTMGSFLKAHPQTATECSIHQLQGKLGLKFDEYALVVPYLKKGGGIVLKLIKSGEDWMNVADPMSFTASDWLQKMCPACPTSNWTSYWTGCIGKLIPMLMRKKRRKTTNRISVPFLGSGRSNSSRHRYENCRLELSDGVRQETRRALRAEARRCGYS